MIPPDEVWLKRSIRCKLTTPQTSFFRVWFFLGACDHDSSWCQRLCFYLFYKQQLEQPMEHTTRTKLPGFGLPVNHYELHEKSAFPSSLNTNDLNEERTVYVFFSLAALFLLLTQPLFFLSLSLLKLSRLALTTLREFTMLHIMNYVTDKPDWRTKVRQIIIFFLFFSSLRSIQKKSIRFK